MGKCIIYYGQAGIGKSITLINAFKYHYDHDFFGTLYINTKCMYKYFHEEYFKR